MYKTTTTSVMSCDQCKKEGTPYPEADGSLGLVKGWCHYDPNYMKSRGLRLNRRVDFCSKECRRAWLLYETARLIAAVEDTDIIYQFHPEDDRRDGLTIGLTLEQATKDTYK